MLLYFSKTSSTFYLIFITHYLTKQSKRIITASQYKKLKIFRLSRETIISFNSYFLISHFIFLLDSFVRAKYDHKGITNLIWLLCACMCLSQTLNKKISKGDIDIFHLIKSRLTLIENEIKIYL